MLCSSVLGGAALGLHEAAGQRGLPGSLKFQTEQGALKEGIPREALADLVRHWQAAGRQRCLVVKHAGQRLCLIFQARPMALHLFLLFCMKIGKIQQHLTYPESAAHGPDGTTWTQCSTANCMQAAGHTPTQGPQQQLQQLVTLSRSMLPSSRRATELTLSSCLWLQEKDSTGGDARRCC